MNRQELKDILLASAKGQDYKNFSVGEIDLAAQNALNKYLNISERGLRRLSEADFAIIEEVLEEITPQAVEDIIGRFAEVRTFGRNEQIMFTVRNTGGARVMRAIVPGARAGIYQARRLDNKHLSIDSQVETVGYALSLEDLLTGRVTVRDYVQLVTRGFVEVIYQRMISALRTAAATAPAANRVEPSDLDIDVLAPALDGVLRIVSAYGTPVIFAFDSVASELVTPLGQNFPANAYSGADVADIREFGHVTIYKGREVVVLPNFLTDNSNANWLFKEDEIFVLPANDKPIKVGFHGNLWVQEVAIPSGGAEWHAHREIGVAVLSNNAIGSVKIEDGEIGNIGSW